MKTFLHTHWKWLVAIVGMIVILVIVATWRRHALVLPSDYSYRYYRTMLIAQHANLPPACTLPLVEMNANEPQGSVVVVNLTCRETGKAATASQIILWESYTIWVSCAEYHQTSACQELQN